MVAKGNPQAGANAYDLIVKGGVVWTPAGTVKTDIAIHKGTIAALGNVGFFSEAVRVIDATNKFVIPGLIDTHTHHRGPGFSHAPVFSSKFS